MTDAAQQLVAGRMARGIVHDFELIEIHEDQIAELAANFSAFPSLLQFRLEFSAIEQPREFIVSRLILQLIRQLERLGHVLNLEHGVKKIAGFGQHRREIDDDP